MGSEVCPFCGKTFKRLKSHLPHCKATKTSKTTSPKHDSAEKETSGQAVVGMPNTTARIKKKADKVPPLPASSSSSSPSSASLPKSAKKKLKLPDQVKMADACSLIATTHVSSPMLPQSVSAVRSKPQKQNSHAFTETVAASVGSSPTAGPLKFPSTAASFTIASQGKNPLEDSILLSTDNKYKSASKKKVAMSQSKTKTASTSLNSTEIDNCQRPYSRSNFWVDTDDETHLSGNETARKSENHQSGITLQDIKTTLDRAKTSRTSILSQAETIHVLNHRTSSTQVLSEGQKVRASSETQPSTDIQRQALTIVREIKQVSLTPLNKDASLLSSRASPVATLLSHQLTSQVSQNGVNAGLKVPQHRTGLPSIPPSLTNLPSPELHPQAGRAETMRTFGGSVMKKLQLDTKGENMGGVGVEDGLAQRRLSRVRLKDLPEWLACKTPSHPRDIVDLMQRGWLWYYRKYIDVKKGGVGGVGMLVAGYCVLSYIWSYPHIKHDRWRKYH